MWQWWGSIETVSTFNSWMQLAVVVFGIITAIAAYWRKIKLAVKIFGIITALAGLLIWVSGNRIDQLQSEKDILVQKRIEDAESSSEKLRDELNETEIKLAETEQALQKKQAELQRQVATIKQYTEIAKWTFNGNRATGYGMATGSPISGWWKDYIRSEKGQYMWKCNNDALEHYKSIIKQYSIYPFPYLLIAQCLKKQGDSSCKGYAEEGFRHAKETV